MSKSSRVSVNGFSINFPLSSNFPSSMVGKLGIQKLRVYVVGDNMFLWSKRKGLDPRQSFTGSTGYNYSALRTVSLGINMEF